jgi:ABC-2 type transport system ATP-binding protein
MNEPDIPAIEVLHLVKNYSRVTAVNDISFSLQKGQILGFLGPNGAGKSTTMRILTGYLAATSGVARICGLSVATQTDEVKRLIGYLPENNPLPEDMRVSEYLYYRGRLKEMPRKKLAHRLDEVLELCDLKHVRHRIIGKLSKGFRQRVGIAEAILAEPPVIIMDEPTIGLDPHQILIVRNLIARLRGRMTVIISSHILPEIEVTCDRVLIINAGRVVAQGTPDELRSNILGHSLYQLEVRGDVAALPSLLSPIKSDFKVEKVGAADAEGFKEVRVSTESKEELGELILKAVLADGQFRVKSFGRAHPTLEDVFLAATRRSWDVIDSPGSVRGENDEEEGKNSNGE